MAIVGFIIICATFFSIMENEVFSTNTSEILRNEPQISSDEYFCDCVLSTQSTGHDNGTRAGNYTTAGYNTMVINNTRVSNNTRAENVSQEQHHSPYFYFTIEGLPSDVTTAEVSRLLWNMALSPHFHFQYRPNEIGPYAEAVAVYHNETEAQWCRLRFRNALTLNFNTT
ncbi:hypothetical protein T03_11486 [Trichinella britovi]|uniref:RRM domain-containing protein n=1 Tax=Trichinella britovi TaxID=45882 RepID=A0A0V1D1D3_TRIBR|nr:hypothetical protein T03_11486 [Trichinella britovi]